MYVRTMRRRTRKRAWLYIDAKQNLPIGGRRHRREANQSRPPRIVGSASNCTP